MPCRVLYLITELGVGGSQATLLRLLQGLDRGSFPPTVACLYNGEGVVAREVRAQGVEVFDARVGSKTDLLAQENE
jgi:hypothetical protein